MDTWSPLDFVVFFSFVGSKVQYGGWNLQIKSAWVYNGKVLVLDKDINRQIRNGEALAMNITSRALRVYTFIKFGLFSISACITKLVLVRRRV